ncbi:MAG: hypothetical protein E6Q66_00765 [Pedobacter sp.]|nr:MAG: hypothetical protein E6Q66_00765 [Pedobacter sp.]
MKLTNQLVQEMNLMEMRKTIGGGATGGRVFTERAVVNVVRAVDYTYKGYEFYQKYQNQAHKPNMPYKHTFNGHPH